MTNKYWPKGALAPCYSGDKSKKFWTRVSRCPNRELYRMGLILQETEAHVLRALIENDPKRRIVRAVKEPR